MKYIANGAVITNRLLFTDKRRIDDIMGGCGLYAFSALRLCTPDCLLAAGVGEDFDRYYGEWFQKNNCTKEGLRVRVDKTTYNELVYYPDGRYDEYSIYGREYERENLPKTMLNPADFLPFLDDARGLYTAGAIDGSLMQGLKDLKKGRSFLVMWETPESSIEPLSKVFDEQGMDGIREQLESVDLFSLNRPESFRIFKETTVEGAIARLKELKKPVYYRVGRDGAFMIDRGKAYLVPMISTVPPEQEIDPTGCGNSSTAAAMWAYCEGCDPLMSCIVGNVVASYNVRQYGPYPDLSRDVFREMMSVADKTYGTIKRSGKERI